MAQYWKDFTADTVGQAPSGMTSRFNAPHTLQVQTDATATLGASLRIIRTTTARTFLSLDAVTDSGRTTIKGRIKYKKSSSSGLTHIGFGINGAGGVGSETCYAGVTSANVARRIAKYASGTFSVVLDASSFSGTGTGVWRHLDFEATPKTGGYDFKIKTYDYDADPELATWSVKEDVSSPITTAGWVGLFCNEAMTYDIEYIAIGTGGDLPPTGQVTPPVNLVADFDFTPASGASPLEVTFTDSSTGSPTSWSWNFGDGATSTSQNPTHTYEFSGTYHVSLTVSDGTNNDTETVLNAVSVNPAVCAPVIVEPTERGCVDSGWSVGYSTPDSAYKIIFAPRRQDNQSVVWFFQLNNVVGTRPIFELDADDGYLIVPGGWRPVWSTTPSEYDSWTPFSAVSDQTTFIRFQHATNFLADTVYIAFRPIVLPSWVDSKMAALALNPAVFETPSSVTYGGSKHQIGTTPQCANEVGKTIPPMPLWSFRLGTGPLKAVFVADQHPGEDYGGISFWEAVDYLLADGTIATALLEQYSIYCYPMANPVGRYGGHYRYTYEPGTEPNPNRDWKATGGFTTYSVDRVHDAIVEDTGDDIPVIGLDFHGHGLTNATYRFVNAATTAYRAAINARFPYADWQDVTTTTEYTFRDFYTNKGAYFAIAIETGYGRNDQMEYSTAVGVAAMEALYDIADDVWAAYPQAGALSAPLINVQPTVVAGTLMGVSSAIFTAPSQTVQPTVSAGTLAEAQAGSFLGPAVSVQPTLAAGTLAGVSVGTFQAPSLSTQPAVSSGVLVGQAGGNFTGPSLFVEPSVSAGSLLGLSAGSFTAPGVSAPPTVVAGALASAKDGVFASPSVSTQPSVQSGALLGRQSGNFLVPSLTLQAIVSSGELEGIQESTGSFFSPSLSIGSSVAAGKLRGPLMYYPEAYAALSMITTNFVAKSRVELRRIGDG